MKNKLIALCCIMVMIISMTGCSNDIEKLTAETEKEKQTVESPTETPSTDTIIPEQTEEPSVSNENETQILQNYVEEAKKEPKAIHYIVSEKSVDDNGSLTRHTYFVIVYDSLKTIIYSMIDDDSENSGRCERFISSMSVEDYNTILDILPNKDIFEPLEEGVDYTREATPEGDETYNIINTNIIYKDENLFTITETTFNKAYEDDSDFTPETLSQAYGSYDENIYPYSPYSDWTDLIDTWLEEYIYDICMCFDDTIVYD